MNAHQRRKQMRKYGRETGLEAIPFSLLRLADAGHWQQAEELRVSMGLPDPLEPLVSFWVNHGGGQWLADWLPNRGGMSAYRTTTDRPGYWLEGCMISWWYHRWRERRADMETP